MQGNLPIAVIFDYPENTIDAEQLNKLMLMHDVFITSRQKSRQSTMCIVIKGIEKFISNIYDARHQILKLNSLKIKADIPATYYGPNDQFKNNSIAQLMAGTANFSPITPINSLPYIAWPASPEVLNLRARMQREAQQAAKGHNNLSPLTASMLQQHNKMTNNNFQMPSNMALSSRSEHAANNSEMHTSGYQSFTTDSSLMDKYNSMKNAAASTSSAADGSSNHTSPENSVNYGNQNIPFGPHVTFVDSPPFKYDNDGDINRSAERRVSTRIFSLQIQLEFIILSFLYFRVHSMNLCYSILIHVSLLASVL